MSPVKPTTIVFVPGAFHRSAGYAAVARLLEAAGYTTKLVDLPSVGGAPPVTGFEPDVAAIRTAIESACDEAAAADVDVDVILFMHSYAGVCGSEAVQGLDRAARQAGRGGVSHLIYCAAFVLPEGAHLMAGLNDVDPPWLQTADDGLVTRALTPDQIFYNDLPEAEQRAWAARLEPFSYRCFYSKLAYAGWRHVPATYLYCLRDRALPVQAQRDMVAAAGVPFREETFDTSHSPFLSVPDQVAAAVRRAAGETSV
jgi:pimeloyl-ACP methyl ester carboxylesterase